MDRGLVTPRVHQSPISTPPYSQVGTGRLDRGRPAGSPEPGSVPLPPSPGTIDKMPWVPATPTGRPRLPRRSSGGKRVKVLARRERGTRLGERSGSSRPRPPGPGPQASGLRCRSTPRGGARGGGGFTRDLGRGTGLGQEGGERERKRSRWKGLATPMARYHLVLRQLNGQVQRCRPVALDPLRGLLRQPRDELLQHHPIHYLVDIVSPSQQPSAARVPELLSHHEGPAVFPSSSDRKR